MTAWRGSMGPYDSWHSKQYQVNTPPRAYQAHTHTQHQHWNEPPSPQGTKRYDRNLPSSFQPDNEHFFSVETTIRCDTRPIALRGDFLHIQSKTTTPREVVLGKNRAQRLDIRLSENLGSKGTSSGMETSCPSGLLCVRNPESKGKAGGPWTHRWHGPTKTHLCRRENVPAKLLLSEMARWPSQKPPMPTCHDMTC